MLALLSWQEQSIFLAALATGLDCERSNSLGPALTAPRDLLTFGEAKFLSLAGFAINREGDRHHQFWAASRGVSGRQARDRHPTFSADIGKPLHRSLSFIVS